MILPALMPVKKLKKEADGSSTAVAQLRPHVGVPEKKHKPVAKINKKKESAKIRFRTHLKESDTGAPQGNKFKVILIQEGLGNLKDCFYYTKECLQNSASLFEGVKCFADHPDQIEEQIHPERSTRDILGHFEDVVYVENAGRGCLQGSLILCQSPQFDWARSLLTNALDYSKKYPSGDFVGLSINASGEADTVPIQDFMSSLGDVPEDIEGKLDEALAQGVDEIRPVSILKDAVSCDLVTEAGAGGRILTMMEKDKPMKKTVKEAKKEAHEEAGMPGDGDGSAAGAADDHADADQDTALFQKMIKQYLGDGSDTDEEEAMKMAKHAYQAAQGMGMEPHEAYEAAGTHLKMAAAVGKQMEEEAKKEGAAPMQQEEEEKKESKKEEAQTPPPAPKSSPAGSASPDKSVEANVRKALIETKAELAKLRESVSQMNVENYLGKKLTALSQKRSPEFISAFRESLGRPKNVAQIEEFLSVFSKAYDAGKEEAGEDEGLLTEKTGFRESGAKVYDFGDCAV